MKLCIHDPPLISPDGGKGAVVSPEIETPIPAGSDFCMYWWQGSGGLA